MRYKVGDTVVFLKDTGKFKKNQTAKITSVVVAEPELQPDGTLNNPLFHVGDNSSSTLMWGEGGSQNPDCRHAYGLSTNPCAEVPMYTPGRYYEATCTGTKGYLIRFDKMTATGPESSCWAHVNSPGTVHTGKGTFSELGRELSQDEINQYFLSQTKTKSENVKHNRTEGNVCESPVSERERERRSTDSIQSGRSKFRLASGSFADTQRAVKSKSKVNRVKIKFST